MTALLCVVLLALSTWLAPVDPDTTEALAPVWPQRAFEAALGAKGVVVELDHDPRRLMSRQLPMQGGRASVRTHAGLMLERLGDAANGVSVDAVLGEGPNALIFDGVWIDQARQSDGKTLLFVSLREGEAYEIERTWMAYEPTRTEAVKGLAVIIPGTFGYPAELYEKWADDLRSRGWSVLRLLSQPSRFTEHVLVRVDGDAADEGAEFARRADDRTAECAYAVEHAARFLEGLDPSLAGKPRTLLGFSGGAILAPGVVAREPQRYESVVLVAGGANAASISIDSTFMKRFIRSVTFEFLGENTDTDRQAFEAAYLGRATLDGYHAAMQFADGAGVLVIDGSFDQAVPFASSTLMVDRLALGGVDPIRRTYPVNHVMLFMALNDSLGQINDWIDGGELTLPPGQGDPNSP